MSVIESFLAGEVPYWLANLARSQESQAMAEAWMREHQEDREAKRRELVELQQSLPPTFSAGEPLVAEGHPAEQILDAITREKVHLAVVGAQGKNAWQRYVLGSTSDALLTHAPCSVLIVHASASA
jgi:nucleotide-binding universal stress UspA family protein